MDLPKQLIGIGGRGCRSGRRRRSSSSRRPLGAAARAACCAVAAVLLLCCCCCCFRGALALSEGAPPPALKARTVELTLADGNEVSVCGRVCGREDGSSQRCFGALAAAALAKPTPTQKQHKHATTQTRHTKKTQDVWRGELAHLSWKPRAFVYRNFLTDAECEHLKQKAAGQLRKSSVVDNETGEERDSDVRTSSGTFFDKGADDVIARIERRVAAATMLPAENQEGLQILKYVDGQKYEPHFDYFFVRLDWTPRRAGAGRGGPGGGKGGGGGGGQIRERWAGGTAGGGRIHPRQPRPTTYSTAHTRTHITLLYYCKTGREEPGRRRGRPARRDGADVPRDAGGAATTTQPGTL